MAVLGAVLNRVQDLAHRLFRLGALLHDLGRIADQRGAVGPPKSAGSGLAIGGLEDASRDLGRHEHRAARERRTRSGRRGLWPRTARGRLGGQHWSPRSASRRQCRRHSAATGRRRLRRRVAACRWSTVLSSPEICSSPDLPLSMSGRPAKLAIPAAGLALASLPPDPASVAEAPELLCFGFAGATFAPCGSAGAAPGSISCARVSLAARATAKRPQIKQRKRRVIGRTVEAPARKGKARRGRGIGSPKLENPRLPRLAPLKRPTYIRPDWPVGARSRAEPAEIWLKDGDRKTSAVGYEAIGETPLLGLAALGLGGPAEEQG